MPPATNRNELKHFRPGGTVEAHPAIFCICEECGRSIFSQVAFRWTPKEELSASVRAELDRVKPDAEGIFVETIAAKLGCPNCKIVYDIELAHPA